jgi:pseudaminic acid synthase
VNKPFIIAELSASHCGSLERAVDLVEVAHASGADAIKLQTWARITMSEEVLEAGPWAGRSLRELYEECRTPWEWHAPLFDRARALGLVGFSTAFDPDSIEFLESLQVPLHKIASFEITDLPLIRCAARTGKPLIISTGMATADEIWDAISCSPDLRRRRITLLRCVSAYPAEASAFNLATMVDMRTRFGCEVGLSDHSHGSAVAAAAAALGASVIEKHITMDTAGPDGHFASMPSDFEAFVQDVRAAAAAMGEVRYGPTSEELAQLGLRRGLWVTRDMRAGDRFSAENVAALRPAKGLVPAHLDTVLGKRAAGAIAAGTPLLGHLIA